jgi:GMP synthase-like glutamine amidotransferase
MRIHCLQHVPWDGPAFFPEWASGAGHDWQTTLVPAAARLPSPESFDALVTLGGPMSLRDQDRHPWLRAEKHYLEGVLAAGKPFFGICLGAQMLAEVHGAPVRPGRHREIGWFPLALTESRHDTWLGDALPAGLEVFFWHDDVFETPAGATRVAGTAASDNQAFVAGSAVGLQFHLEVTPQWAAHLVRRDADQIVPDAYVQSADEILARPGAAYERSHAALARLLDRWLSGECQAPRAETDRPARAAGQGR